VPRLPKLLKVRAGPAVPPGCVPDNDHCGGASFPVNFVLAGLKAGAIIQHVFIELTIWDCKTGNVSRAVDFEYFEAWQVRADNQGVRVVPSANWADSGEKYNDLYQVCGGPNSCGSFSVHARIAYAPGYLIIPCGTPRGQGQDCWTVAGKPRDKAADFCDPNSKLPFAGILPRREIAGVPAPFPPSVPPRGWPQNERRLTRHDMTREWSCCEECPPPKECPTLGDHCATVPNNQ